MSEFTVNTPLPHIPDNLTIPQFILREIASPRPQRSLSVPFFIDDKTGRRISYEEVRLYFPISNCSLQFLGAQTHIWTRERVESEIRYRYVLLLHQSSESLNGECRERRRWYDIQFPSTGVVF